MLIFQCNTNMCGEDWGRWNRYLENQVSENKPILLPQDIDFKVITDNESDVIDFIDDFDDEDDDNDDNEKGETET